MTYQVFIVGKIQVRIVYSCNNNNKKGVWKFMNETLVDRSTRISLND